MIKILAKSIREYKKPSLLAPVFVTGEVIMECIIPFVTANLVNQIRAGCSMGVILRYGLVLVIMATLSLLFGATGTPPRMCSDTTRATFSGVILT